MVHNQNIGKLGEEIAFKYLQEKGYQILEQNYYSRWGELDIIAVKANKLSFIEVKTRVGDQFGKPHDSVTKFKILHLKRPIQYYLLKNNYKKSKLSLDVVSVVLNEDQSVKTLKHFENVGTF